ncbi:MAG: undecaprenyldiphospho-muramoylpentapeptide beta-N-acetylglucosaminyltransferase [Deltaproteobacteria bacterium]|nr:undecaprenyldiphospho-muramoylpentapeptide beta-N-acetylglucosaminyltransferase [Deltaproteobacteria bacterium]
MTRVPRRWIVAGGGTGGHVTPALALGERIAARGDEVLFLGTERGLETRLVPAAGFSLVALPSRPLQGRSRAERAAVWLGLPRVTLAARRALLRFRAEIVVSVGGYAAVAPVLAAATLRLPIALVNTDAVPGLANRAAGRLARRIFVGFSGASPVFERAGAPDRVRVTGVPLRRALVEAFRGAPPRRTFALPLRLLVFGGSQGARQINEAMLAALPLLDLAKLEIFHQTGEADRERVAAAYEAAGARAQVVAFEPEMPARYRWADLALCRSGALTVAELALAGLPALLVPYPFAANDEQSANARELASAGAAHLLPSKQFSAKMLSEELGALLADPPRLRAMGERAAELARPQAAEDIIEECVRLLDA